MIDATWLNEYRRKSAAQASEDLKDWIEENGRDGEIPALDQRLPDCPICYQEVDYDDRLVCSNCRISWSDAGATGEWIDKDE